MAKTIEHVKASLAAFKRQKGRDPATIEDYREISRNAKRMTLLAEAAAEIAPDDAEVAIPTYFCVKEMRA